MGAVTYLSFSSSHEFFVKVNLNPLYLHQTNVFNNLVILITKHFQQLIIFCLFLVLSILHDYPNRIWVSIWIIKAKLEPCIERDEQIWWAWDHVSYFFVSPLFNSTVYTVQNMEHKTWRFPNLLHNQYTILYDHNNNYKVLYSSNLYHLLSYVFFFFILNIPGYFLSYFHFILY